MVALKGRLFTAKIMKFNDDQLEFITSYVYGNFILMTDMEGNSYLTIKT